MAALENINIDFQILRTGDPHLLILCDTSEWAHIEDSPAIVEIILPNEKLVTHYLSKKKNNIFNTSNLYLSPYGKFYILPDGIYRITVKGSPDNYNKTRYVIRDEKLQLDVDKLFLENFDRDNDDLMTIISDINLLLQASRAAIRQDEKKLAVKYYKEAKSLFDNYQECNNC